MKLQDQLATFYRNNYRVFDNGAKDRWQVVHFDKCMSNYEKEALRFWMAMTENGLKFKEYLKKHYIFFWL
jgi:hypothetical protein